MLETKIKKIVTGKISRLQSNNLHKTHLENLIPGILLLENEMGSDYFAAPQQTLRINERNILCVIVRIEN